MNVQFTIQNISKIFKAILLKITTLRCSSPPPSLTVSSIHPCPSTVVSSKKIKKKREGKCLMCLILIRWTFRYKTGTRDTSRNKQLKCNSRDNKFGSGWCQHDRRLHPVGRSITMLLSTPFNWTSFKANTSL